MNNLITASQEMMMSSKEIATLTDKQHKHVIRDIRVMIDELDIDGPVLGYVENTDSRGYTAEFRLNKELTETLITGYSIRLRSNVIRRLNELEEERKSIVPALPDFTNPAAAAIAWAEQYQAAQLAIATKAEIGSRREATSMATASVATRKAKRLEIELDKSKQYATIKRMSLLYHGIKFNWRELKTASQEMGLPPIDVFDANYGTVKAYHEDVWMEAYGLTIEQGEG